MGALSEKELRSTDRLLSIEIARITEQAAVAAATLRGKGSEKEADQAAVTAMRKEMDNIDIRGTIRIGEGERDEAPMLFIGEEVGSGKGPQIDIAVDPLEGTTICAKDMPNALAVIAMAQDGAMLNAPDVYMEKIAVGPGYSADLLDLDRPIQDTMKKMAKEKGCNITELTACILDRPRHSKMISSLREIGVAVRLIGDGDVAGVIHTTDTEETGIDLYVGIGGAPEGVLAAAAMRCMGGQILGRLILDTNEKKERAERMGVSTTNQIYTAEDMASGSVIFAASGVTDGNMLKGVKFYNNKIVTDTIVMRSRTGTVRRINTEHRDRSKFHILG